MPGASLFDMRRDAQRGFKNAAKNTSFAGRSTSTLTEPVTVDAAAGTANTFVAPCGDRGVLLSFFGQDTDNDQFDWRIYGIDKSFVSVTAGVETWQYDHNVLLQCSNTLGAAKGGAGGLATASDFWVDTIIPSTSVVGISTYKVRSPANDLQAWIYVPTYGHWSFRLDFDLAGVSPGTEMNFIWRAV